MLTHPTIEKLQALHLTAMAQAFDHQRGSSQHAELSFEDRVGLLVDHEPRLLHELVVSRGDGTYARLHARLSKLDVLAIDD
jgi:hypothetical protein